MKSLRLFWGLGLLLFIALNPASSQPLAGTSYEVAFVMPFKAVETGVLIDEFSTKEHHKISAGSKYLEENLSMLDFYHGAMMAAMDQAGDVKLKFRLIDNAGNDSVTREILQSGELQTADCIIAPVAGSQIKLVADYAKSRQIPCIVPFSPSKTLIRDNPYAIKFAPLIDAHLENLFNCMKDSFAGAPIVLLTDADEKNTFLSAHLIQLMDSFNANGGGKMRYQVFQPKGNLGLLIEQKLPAEGKQIIFIASYNDAFIQSCLRGLSHYAGKRDFTLFGLPTWLDSEILRLDYLNALNLHFTDQFYADTTRPEVVIFKDNFKEQHEHQPGKQAFYGYDIMAYLLEAVNDYGKEWISKRPEIPFNGLGHQFLVTPYFAGNQQDKEEISFYTNQKLRVFEINSYRVEFVR